METQATGRGRGENTGSKAAKWAENIDFLGLFDYNVLAASAEDTKQSPQDNCRRMPQEEEKFETFN